MNWYSGLILNICWNLSYLPNDVHSINNLPEHNMLAIKVRTLFQCDEELASVRIRPFVSHRQASSLRVPSHEVLVGKVRRLFRWVYRGWPWSILSVAHITALNHELVNDPVKLCPKEMQVSLFFSLVNKLLHELIWVFASWQTPKVFCCLWGYIYEELNYYTSSRSWTDGDIEKYLWIFRHI